ncbi:SDR family oxidoreductase [Caulobacter sp. S45]|uniref:SDR family NAD(P)-dependent oxidoreductase n=1 Tax=Caulobacter sp. S45 TaxID=1641861 RepID=UPI00131C81BE|nr:SDR family NAD(P)-dependent oxidoreductase [Caulobacter sp. S45]
MTSPRPLAVVTGASSGIGYQLAQLCVENGYDLAIAADEPTIVEAKQSFERLGAQVRAVQTDLSTEEGVQQLLDLIGDEPIDILCANAGHGLGHGFLDENWKQARHVVDTNITGTLFLVHNIAKGMRDRDRGRILFTGSIAGLMPGSFQAVYNGTKAFVDSFSFALRNELKDTGVSVTCLMPGPVDTEFFERADLMDTKVGQGKKSDPAKVAKTGFDAMMKGEGDVVAGLKNKFQAAVAAVTPQSQLAEMHRGMAEPGSGKQ